MPIPTANIPVPLACMLLATVGVAQQWNLMSTTTPFALGTDGGLLADDGQGLIGYDEVAAATVRLTGSGWLAHPSSAGARLLTTLVSSPVRAYLFGGLQSGTTLTNDLWRFDRVLNDWVLMQASSPSGPGPSPRFGAQAAALGTGFILFFGGQDSTGLCNDTWMIADVGAPWWAQQPTPPALVGRLHHAMATGPDSTIALFGGDNGAPLGDTWIFGTSWTQYSGPAPAAAAYCRMAYDRARDMTVLIHPNGETWEWNGYEWRLVPATGAPAWTDAALVYSTAGHDVLGLQPNGSVHDVHRYTPSLADFQLTLDIVCFASGALELNAYQRSLPILGQSIHLRATGVPVTSWFFGAFELSAQQLFPIGCGCLLGLNGASTGVQFVPGSGTNARDWFLPIANNPALNGAAIDVQGIVLDAPQCFLMTTQRGTLTPGL